MTMTLSERLVQPSAPTHRHGPGSRPRPGADSSAAPRWSGRRWRSNPWGYLVRPASAYDTVCGNGRRTAPTATRSSAAPSTAAATPARRTRSSAAGGRPTTPPSAAGPPGTTSTATPFATAAWQCRCAEGTCDQRRVACNQFRYGQCSLDVPASQHRAGGLPDGVLHTAVAAVRRHLHQFQRHGQPDRDPLGAVPDRAVPGRQPGCGRRPAANRCGSVGWAYDPDQPATEIQVAVYVDGSASAGSRPADRGTTSTPPTGSAATTASTSPSRPAPAGTRVDMYAINVGGGTGNPCSGSGTATVGASADRLSGLPGPPVPTAPSGCGAGPSTRTSRRPRSRSPSTGTGSGVAWFPTGGARPDVNSVFGISGDHGFDFTFESPPGDHTVEVYRDQRRRWCRQSADRRAARSGSASRWDTWTGASVGGDTVRLPGWAFDPDQPDTAIQVAVYRNGDGRRLVPDRRTAAGRELGVRHQRQPRVRHPRST